MMLNAKAKVDQKELPGRKTKFLERGSNKLYVASGNALFLYLSLQNQRKETRNPSRAFFHPRFSKNHGSD
jgi:hypothetical protein